jgi:hypothetical protein
MRRLLFAVLLLSLLGVLLLVGFHRAGSTPPSAPTGTAVARRRQTQRPPPPAARRQVLHFVAAFLAYEVGRGGSGVEARIHACASPHLARQLLSRPPTPPGRASHAGARIISLRVDDVPGHPDLLLASGDARRPEAVEPFSFLFARRDGRWLAVAPGE